MGYEIGTGSGVTEGSGQDSPDHQNGPDQQNGCDQHDAAVAQEVAALAEEVQQLRTALHRRPVIDMAKGAVMAFSRCGEDDAFSELSRVSQTNNVKLFELATALLADLPGGAAGVGGRTGELVAENWTGDRGDPA